MDEQLDYLPGFQGSRGIVAFDLIGQHGSPGVVVCCVLCRKDLSLPASGLRGHSCT